MTSIVVDTPDDCFEECCGDDDPVVTTLCDCDVRNFTLILSGLPSQSPQPYYVWADENYHVVCEDVADPTKCRKLFSFCYVENDDGIGIVQNGTVQCLLDNLNRSFSTNVIEADFPFDRVRHILGTSGNASDRGVLIKEVHAKGWTCKTSVCNTLSHNQTSSDALGLAWDVYRRDYVYEISYFMTCFDCLPDNHKIMPPYHFFSQSKIYPLTYLTQTFYDYTIYDCNGETPASGTSTTDPTPFGSFVDNPNCLPFGCCTPPDTFYLLPIGALDAECLDGYYPDGVPSYCEDQGIFDCRVCTEECDGASAWSTQPPCPGWEDLGAEGACDGSDMIVNATFLVT